MNARRRRNVLVGLLSACLLAAPWMGVPCFAGDAAVLDDGFDEAPSAVWSDNAIDTAPATGETFLGQFGAQTVTCSLADLPEHRWVRLSFDVYAIGSWDGDASSDGPDLFTVSLGDGSALVRTSFGWDHTQAYPGRHGIHQTKAHTGSRATHSLGFVWRGRPADDIYHFDIEFPHSGDSLELRFASTQDEAIDNESWGLDNVKVTTQTEPTSPVVDDQALETVWESLRSDDGAVAEKAMWQLVASGERGVAFAAPKLSRLIPDTSGTMNPSDIWVSRDQSALSSLTTVTDPEVRRAALAEQALRLIGSPAAHNALQKIERPEAGTPISTLVLTVRDAETQEPIANQAIRVRTTCASSGTVQTDSSGQARVHVLGNTPPYLSLGADAPGHVPMSFAVTDLDSGDPLPAELTLDLPQGTSIGGKLVNEDGDPVANAQVYLLVPNQGPDDAPRVAVYDHAVTTDADGQWRCDIVPAELDDIWIRLAHPDYIDDTTYGKTPKPSIEQLRDMTGTMVMKKGLKIEGVVVDDGGNPIADAQVAQGGDRWGSHYPETRTDSQGRFVFDANESGRVVLTIQAEGFSPDIKDVLLHANTGLIRVTLQPGNTIRGRIIDPSGEPLEGAIVVADTWRGHRSIEMRTTTDHDGRFGFTNAPPDAILFDILKQGYADLRNHAITADSEDVTITMRRPLRVTGSVVDAKTGEPIPEFRLVPGIGFENNPAPIWQQRNSKPHHDGTFEMTFSYPRPSHYVRIEADGYAPVASRGFTMDEGEINLMIELQQAEALTGTLTNAHGDPVAGTDVYLAIGRNTPYIENGRIREIGGANVAATTDGEGRFTFPAQDDAYLLIALSDDGYAEVDAETFDANNGAITLTPWATIKGQLLVGDQARAGEQVNIFLQRPFVPDKPRTHHDIKTTTDQDGRFVLDRVPAGEGSVGRYLEVGESMWSQSVSETFTAEPGQTIEVTLGGTGRPVAGRFAWPAGVEAMSFGYGNHRMSTKMDPQALTEVRERLLPKDLMSWDVEKRQAWAISEEGKKVAEELRAASDAIYGLRLNYNFAIEPDGSFRIENVQPGTYQLTMQVHSPPPANQCGYGDEVARLSVEVNVPPLADGIVYLDEPLDIGTHTVTLLKPAPQAGEPAPEFTAPLLDLAAEDPAAALKGAKQLSLSDLKGKYVLLDFWATWCGPCVAETPHLKAVWEAYGDDDRFEIVALSLDNEPKAPTDYANKNGMAWKQAYLGEWGKHTAQNDYAVRGIPSIWLIGPDGNIVATGLRGEAIHTAVEKVLAEGGFQ